LLQPTTAANDGFRSRAPRPAIYLCYSHLGSKVEFRISMRRMEKSGWVLITGIERQTSLLAGSRPHARARKTTPIPRDVGFRGSNADSQCFREGLISTFFDLCYRKTCFGITAPFRYIRFLCPPHPRQRCRCPCELRAHELPSGVGVEQKTEIRIQLKTHSQKKPAGGSFVRMGYFEFLSRNRWRPRLRGRTWVRHAVEVTTLNSQPGAFALGRKV
jgi:hypothetical protein